MLCCSDSFVTLRLKLTIVRDAINDWLNFNTFALRLVICLRLKLSHLSARRGSPLDDEFALRSLINVVVIAFFGLNRLDVGKHGQFFVLLLPHPHRRLLLVLDHRVTLSLMFCLL